MEMKAEKIKELVRTKRYLKESITKEIGEDKKFKEFERKYPNYTKKFALFCLWAGITPTQFLNLHAEWIKNPHGKNKAAELLEHYRDEILYPLRDEDDMPANTITKFDNSVRAFISFFFPQQRLPVKNMKGYDVVKTPTYKPSLDEIKRLCDVGETLDRFFILFLFQSCLRIGDALKLRYTPDMDKQIKAGEKVIIFDYRSSKFDVQRYSGFSYDALDSFLAWKQKKNIRVGDYLFKGQKGEPLNKIHLNRRLKALQERAGIETYGEKLRIHSLRGAGLSALDKAGVNIKLSELISGHTIKEQKGAYVRIGKERIREEVYEKAKEYLNPYLARYEKSKTLEKEVEDLKKLMIKQQGIIESLQRQLDEIKMKINGGV